MQLKIEKYIDKPSFYFAAHQGLVFAVMLAAAVLSGVIGCFFTEIYISVFSSIFFTLFFLPYVILYTFLTYLIFKNEKKKKYLFDKKFFWFNFIVLFILYRIFAFDETATGAGVGILSVISIVLLFWGFILLNLIPYIVLSYGEKKYNISTTVEPFVKNGFYFKTILYSLVIYFLICILICALAVIFMVYLLIF